MKTVKMILALLLCAALALGGCAFAEESGEVAVFDLCTGITVETRLPAGYSAFAYDLGQDVPAGLLCFIPDDPAGLYMLMDINYDEEVAGLKLNDFTDEQIGAYREQVIGDMDMLSPTITLTQTANGTKLLVFDESNENDEYAIIATLYDGHWISLLLYRSDVTLPLSEADHQTGIDLMSNSWFVETEEYPVENIIADGGWIPADDQTVTEEMAQLFDKAFEGFAGAGYEPLALLSTQVVAGINYRFLAKQTLVTAQPVVTYGIVTLYQDLEGNVTFTGFESFTEEDEDELAENVLYAGGWLSADDQTVTEELAQLFDKAFEGFAGAGYEPLALLGSQVVAGINYRFLAKQTLVTAQPVVTYGIVTLYQDLEGNVTFTGFEPLEGAFEEEPMEGLMEGVMGGLMEGIMAEPEDELAENIIAVGGWIPADDQTVTEELAQLFDKAFEGFAGAGYEPLALLGTQVVAGINYRFLAKQTLVTAQPVVTYGIVTLYQDLEGNVTFTGFESFTEEDEDELAENVLYAGGWLSADDQTVTEELAQLFDKAFEGFAGAGYEPLALLGSQVVAGINYRFLAKQTLVTAQPVVTYGFVTLYQDLEGNVTFLDFTPVTVND